VVVDVIARWKKMENVNSPLRGANSIVTASLSRSLRSILYSLITTSLAQVASVFRTKARGRCA
jgi:hypothetical protein